MHIDQAVWAGVVGAISSSALTGWITLRITKRSIASTARLAEEQRAYDKLSRDEDQAARLRELKFERHYADQRQTFLMLWRECRHMSEVADAVRAAVIEGREPAFARIPRPSDEEFAVADLVLPEAVRDTFRAWSDANLRLGSAYDELAAARQNPTVGPMMTAEVRARFDAAYQAYAESVRDLLQTLRAAIDPGLGDIAD